MSAVLTVALAGIWIASGFGVAFASTGGVTLTVLHGTVGAGWLPPRDRIDETFWFNDGQYSLRWWFRTPASRGVFVHVPLWPGVLAGLGITLLAAHKGRKIPPGCCQTCGFDLAGLPLATPCPECGASVDPQG